MAFLTTDQYPVSLMTSFSKVFENVMDNRLLGH